MSNHTDFKTDEELPYPHESNPSNPFHPDYFPYGFEFESPRWQEGYSEGPFCIPPQVRDAIRNDDVKEFGRLLGLAHYFISDASHDVGKFFRANNNQEGIHQLIDVCIGASAVQCLYQLTLWCAESHHLFRYDLHWVYERARRVAMLTGQFRPLLALDFEPLISPRDRECLFAFLLAQARSPDAIQRISDAWGPEKRNYHPFLLKSAGDKDSQPAVVEAFSQSIGPLDRINKVASWRNGLISALSVAAETLNLSQLEVLLRKGAQPFGAPFNHTARNPRHPLFCALRQTLPADPLVTPGSPEWRKEILAFASHMHTAASLLLDAVPPSFKYTSAYRRILTKATALFLRTLRSFILRDLLRLRDEYRFTDIDNLISSILPDFDDISIYKSGTAFNPDISHIKLRNTLKGFNMQLHRPFLDIWSLLMTTEMVEAVDRYVSRSFGSQPLTGEDCLWVLLIATQKSNSILTSRVVPKSPRALPYQNRSGPIGFFREEIERITGKRITKSGLLAGSDGGESPPSSAEASVWSPPLGPGQDTPETILSAEEFLLTPRPFHRGARQP